MGRIIKLVDNRRLGWNTLIKSEWNILRAILENSHRGYCSIDLIVRGSEYTRQTAKKRVHSLARKNYLVDGSKGILQLTRLALECEKIGVHKLGYTALSYEVPTKPREYETSLMSWLASNKN